MKHYHLRRHADVSFLFTAAGVLLGMTRGYMRGIMGRIDTFCHWTIWTGFTHRNGYLGTRMSLLAALTTPEIATQQVPFAATKKKIKDLSFTLNP